MKDVGWKKEKYILADEGWNPSSEHLSHVKGYKSIFII